MAKQKCCIWCKLRQVCALQRQLYKIIDREWHWFDNKKKFNKAIHTAIARHCKFYQYDKAYKTS